MVKKKYSLLEDGVELIVCSPYVYKSLDKKQLEKLRENDSVIIGTWTIKDCPSGEFLATLSEDFAIIYSHIKRIEGIEKIKSNTDFDGIFQIRKITIYTSLISPQDVLELFFIQKKVMDIALTHQQAFEEFDERICRNGHCVETEFFLHIFHFLFDRLNRLNRLNREFTDLDCVPHDTMHELIICDRYDLEGDSLFWNTIEGADIYSYTRNIHATENFIEKVRGEILHPEHFIVASDTRGELNVINLAGDNIMLFDSLRTFEITQGKRLPQGHCFHDKRTRNFDWAVLKKVRTGVGETQIVGLEKTYDELCTLHDRDFVLIDDMVDGGNTLLNAVNFLHENGAKSIIACVTHGVLTGNAVEQITNCEYLDKLYISNSLPQKQAVIDCDKIEIIDIINDVVFKKN